MEKENKAFKIFRVIITLIAIVFLLLFVSGALWGIVNIGNLVGGLLCVWLIFVFGTRKKYKSLKVVVLPQVQLLSNFQEVLAI